MKLWQVWGWEVLVAGGDGRSWGWWGWEVLVAGLIGGPVVAGDTNVIIVMRINKELEEIERLGTTW